MSRAALMTNAWLAAAALIFAASAQAAEPPRPQDWPTYGHDAGGARYSPLAQITPQNVASLKIAWTYHMDPTPNASGEGFKPFSTTTPLVVDGRMYLGTPYHRMVALDPANGKELWVHELPIAISRPCAVSPTGPATRTTATDHRLDHARRGSSRWTPRPAHRSPTSGTMGSSRPRRRRS
jgi:glucose dehydrogenase